MTRRPEPPAPPPSAGYDFARFGRHRLRAPHAAIIDLPVPIAARARVWVATIWPDPHAHGGWARQLWPLDPVTGRGWQLPHELAAGDVLEFGADTTSPVRWYGIMDSYEVDCWATVQDPYSDPATAWTDAQRLLAAERYLDPVAADTSVAVDAVPRPGRPRCHRHRPQTRRDPRRLA